jgi:hypothetical protein
LYAAGVEDENGISDEELDEAERKYTQSATNNINSQADAGTRNIEMVRKLLAAFPSPPEEPGLSDTTHFQRWLDVFGELNDKPMSKPCQVQSVTLLANIIRWFSMESGRSEEEILERLEKPYLKSRDESLSRLQQNIKSFRDMR